MSVVRPVAARGDLFDRRIREQWTDQLGRRLDILIAGCGRSGELRLDRMDTRVTGVDEDRPELRDVVASRADLDAWALDDMRSVPIPPRSFDVVYIEFLLERIKHAELVLDRILGGLRPGGLLLVRMRDRDSAYGFCTRALPSWLRRALWRRFVADVPEGPLPAVYEPVTSREGMQTFCLIRGLQITDEAKDTSGPALYGPLGRLAESVCALVERLSAGRLPATHDELTLVIRKPQNHFARLI
ncbi:hypothetical protein HNP84_003845 [Thermocatellispora tengchongensis]|uniref:Methyltransferase type 11 domain-containing protein n=1 Tax=Thermocatellispora tengchongensis TaxID=1073253 RepID=A0A840P536_9ACTN|nr:class I SAM-dependent methyltransferase [Thermocatellispora tengchongensis]MBB5134119.1 hypothetical protein [Thermocatellispora tengchongensis]